MTTCVFITGTNAVGKSSVERAIMDRCGGISTERDMVTYLADGVTCLAGRYLGCKYGGVDRITNAKGSSCTSELANVVERGLSERKVIFCEGSFMDTFGMNLINAMFKADNHIIVNLYADARTLWNRLNGRSEGKNGNGRDFPKVLNKQKRCLSAAQKWHEIGVKVLQINTAEYNPEQIAELIYKEL